MHAHAVSQGRFRCASRRARLLDTSHRRRLQTQRVGKAARGVLTTDAMNHLESFRSCINSCRLPALAPIHSPCPEWSCNVCLYPAPCPCSRSGVRHVVCVSSCTLRSPRPRMSPRVCLLQFVTNICVVMHHVMVILLLLRSNQPTSRDPFLVSLRTLMGRGERLRSYWNSHMSNASPAQRGKKSKCSPVDSPAGVL